MIQPDVIHCEGIAFTADSVGEELSERLSSRLAPVARGGNQLIETVRLGDSQIDEHFPPQCPLFMQRDVLFVPAIIVGVYLIASLEKEARRSRQNFCGARMCVS